MWFPRFRNGSLCGRSEVLRRSCSVLRNSSCLSARQGSGGKSVVRLTPLSGADRAKRTAAVGAYRKATTVLVSSMLSFSEQEDTRWAQELLPTSNLGSAAHCDPHLAPPPALPESTWDRPFSGLHYAALARLEHAQSTSQICSMSRAGFMPTRSMLRFLRCSARSPLAPCSLPPDGSLGHGSAGNARRTASRVLSRWVSSFALPTPSAW